MKIPEFKYLQDKKNLHYLIAREFPEFFKYLNEHYNCKKFTEKVYLYYFPGPHVCGVCGKPVKYTNFVEGYREFCSPKCVALGTKEKKKKTMIARYGKPYCMQVDSFREKSKQTCLEKYGVEYIGQSEHQKTLRKQTYLDRYGVEHISKSKEFKDKVKQTCLAKYGVEQAFQADEIKEKIKQTFRENFIESNPHILDYTEEGDWICKCPHPECNECEEKCYIISSQNYNDRKRLNIEPCTRLQPIGSNDSTGEREVAEFVESLVPIERGWNGLYYETNQPKQIDIYIPSLKLGIESGTSRIPLGIEYNGTYHHSLESGKECDYHFKKWKAAKDQGIRLITIWEHWWLDRREECERFLKDQIMKGRTYINFYEDDFIHLDTCSEEEWKSINPEKVQLYEQEINEYTIVDSGIL